MRKAWLLAAALLVALSLLAGVGTFTSLGVPAWFTSGSDEASDLVLPGDVKPSATGAGAAPRLEGTAARSPGGPGGESGSLPRHRITGRCVDESGRGVAGARVLSIPDTNVQVFPMERVGRDGCPACATTSDEAARFVVEVKKEAPFHVLIADALGFGLSGRGELPIGAEVTLVLRPARTLRGRVSDVGGSAIAGARVRALLLVDTLQLAREATSGTDGHYVLEGLPVPPTAGASVGYMHSASLEASATGYASVRLGLPGLGAPDAPEQDITLLRGTSVQGRVEDAETGKPVPSATVVAHSREGSSGYMRPGGGYYSNPWAPRELARKQAGEDGTFVLEHLPCMGPHGVSGNRMATGQRLMGGVAAWAPGYGATAADVPFLPDGTTHEVVLKLERCARVTGRVLDAGGEPVAEAHVYAVVEGRRSEGYVPPVHEGAPVAYTRSGPDGRFAISAAPAPSAQPIEVLVSAQHPRAGSSRVKMPAAQAKVRVTAGAEVDAGDLVFPAPDPTGPSCVLVIETPQGRPCFGATLGTGGFGGDRTDAEGRATFTWSVPTPERPSKTVHLQVRAPGFAPTTVTLVPPPEGPAEVRMRLEPGFRLAGTIVRADGTPVAHAPVAVANGALAVDRAFTTDLNDAHQQMANGPRGPGRPALYAMSYADGAGRFVFEDLPSGPWHVRASTKRRVAPAPGTPPLQVTASDVASDTLDLVLRLPPDDSPVTGRLLVRVLDDATGEPVRDALLLVRQEGRVVATAGSRGVPGGAPPPPPVAGRPGVEASGPGVEPGTYRVTEVPAGRVTLHVDAPGRRPATLDDVEVVGDQEVRPRDVRLTRGVCVVGRVNLPDGERATERQVMLYELGAPYYVQPRLGPLAADGSFSVCGIGPGRYRVVCLQQGFQRYPAPIVPAAARELVVGEGTADVRIEGAWVAMGTLQLRPDDARLPPAPWDSEALTHERKVFGAATRLTLRDEAGAVLLDLKGVHRHFLGLEGTQYVPAGRYTARIEFPDGEAREESVTVQVGRLGEFYLRKKP